MTATGSPVIKVDQVATNGIIHVIDKVMYPLPKYDIVDFVSVCPFYSTLLAAVQAADLVDALRGKFLIINSLRGSVKRSPVGQSDTERQTRSVVIRGDARMVCFWTRRLKVYLLIIS